MKRRRPYVAKIKRDDPFQAADRPEIEAMVRRITAAGGCSARKLGGGVSNRSVAH
jgi:hypothetical protein